MALSIYYSDYPHPQNVCHIQSFGWMASQFFGPASRWDILDVHKVEADGHEGYALRYNDLCNQGVDPGEYDHNCGLGYTYSVEGEAAQAALKRMLTPYIKN